MKLPLCLAVLGCTAIVAHADLSFTQTTKSPFDRFMGGGAAAKTKNMFKGDMSRVEINVMGSPSIMLTKGKNLTQIDPTSKTYTVNTLNPRSNRRTSPSGGGQPQITFSGKKVGNEQIKGVNSPHWRLNMDMKNPSAQGPQNIKMTMDVWGSKTRYPLPSSNNQTPSMPGDFRSILGKDFKIKGNVSVMKSAFATVPLRLTVSMNGQVVSTTETSDISSKSLPMSFFKVPSGYRKVTPEEWQKRVNAEMNKKMGAMMGRMPRGR